MTQEEKDAKIGKLYTEKLNLEAKLTAGDYKVIKCAEAQAAGAAMPYDVEALHAERQAWRDRVNAIEAEIAEIEKAETDEEVTINEG